MHSLARLLDPPGGRENIIKKRGGVTTFLTLEHTHAFKKHRVRLAT